MIRRNFLRLCGLATGAAGQSRWAAAATVTAGFAEADITPDIGMEQPGGYGKVFHKTLHDPCKVRVALFDDGTTRAVICGVDALMVPRGLVQGARTEIEARTGIAGHAVMIAASHSHSSGPTGMIQPGEYDFAPEYVRKLAYEQSSMADARYLRRVREQIVAAVIRAEQTKAPLQCGVGRGIEDAVAFNRRFRMKDGRTYTHPGAGNPAIVKPAGPVDPEVGVVGAWTPEGKLVGCVVNFACHATTNPGGISANYIYYMEQAIRGIHGPQTVVVFTAGASGDITQVDNLSPYQRPGAEEWAHLVGGRVGAEAAKVLLSMPRGALTPVDARLRVLRLARRKPSPEVVRKAVEMVRQEPAGKGTDWVFAKETVLLEAMLSVAPQVDVEVQAIQVGPAVFVSNPAEYFTEFGLEIKQKSPFPYTFPVELANGCVGYVPTEEALSDTGGGYETRLTSYSNLVPPAGREIAMAGIGLANQMRPGKLPEPTPAPTFREPWTYGNVPPQRD